MEIPECFNAYPDSDKHRWEIRLKVSSNGANCFCEQCTRCGQKGRAIKSNKLLISQRRTAALFDEQLRNELYKQQSDAYTKQKSEENKEWRRWYNEYLSSPQWRQRRTLVMDRAGGKCEGCRSRPANQVHHITYENVGEEFLWRLVAICHQCHERIHPHMRVPSQIWDGA